MHSLANAPAKAATLTRERPPHRSAANFESGHGRALSRPEALAGKAECLIRVVDPDGFVRRAVIRFFSHRTYRVETFASLPSFLNSKAHDGPCCLVTDVFLPGLCDLTLPQFVARARRAEQIIFVSESPEVRLCVRALRAGAVDFLMKPLKGAELSEAVETALERSREVLRGEEERIEAEGLLRTLTPREREVLGLVIAGRINKEIGAELGASEKTIKKHRGQVMRKLMVGSVAELARFSILHGVRPAAPMGPRSHIQP